MTAELTENTAIAWDNRSEAERCVNIARPLTTSPDLTREGLAMKATRSRQRPVTPVSLRLARQSSREGSCLLWRGHLTPTGYGNIKLGRKSHGVHRVAYETWIGPIPPGLEIDHLCRVRNCIEPDHLEVVDRATNLQRASEARAPRTTCFRGHDLTLLNAISVSGRCRKCRESNAICPGCGKSISQQNIARHRSESCPAREVAK